MICSFMCVFVHDKHSTSRCRFSHLLYTTVESWNKHALLTFVFVKTIILAFLVRHKVDYYSLIGKNCGKMEREWNNWNFEIRMKINWNDFFHQFSNFLRRKTISGFRFEEWGLALFFYLCQTLKFVSLEWDKFESSQNVKKITLL